ncbi:hypothetical protein L211DRAFT_867239 [Terfezia boudieri ATCC MYA-4762]|uniref:Uncharacterized protein n=1 Tax=Terfezia boudieri ATCC MYA-4762 TaxID=1051890 RepID=A0A3N4LQX4_9PEZI|nr:hypothetical protein L211DRAFT_867239 [Terfezia boudieri ATCC MYA-4762]
MLSSKILRLSFCSYYSQGFHHGLRGGLNTMARRGFTASSRNRKDDNELQSTSSAATFTIEKLHTLDKDITILKSLVADVKLSLRELDRKVDKRFDNVNSKFDDVDWEFEGVDWEFDKQFSRLVLLIVGGFVLKGGFDVYRDGLKNRKEV